MFITRTFYLSSLCTAADHLNGVQVFGRLLVVLAFMVGMFPTLVVARAETACLDAIKVASQKTGVPENLLIAVAKTETGRAFSGDIRPWPWAINILGKGQWFVSETALLESALEQISQGETSFDLGCFQLNYRWHGNAFDSLDAMIAPHSNALYAAQFLKSLEKEFGDWRAAVGAYHSRDETRARTYLIKFNTHFDDDLDRIGELAFSNTTRKERKKNSFPLLQSSEGHQKLGSLMPFSTN